MRKVPSAELLEELKFFRWTLCYHRKKGQTTNNTHVNGSTISIESDHCVECEEIIGSLIRYHSDRENDEAIGEELIIAKYGLEKVNTFCY